MRSGTVYILVLPFQTSCGLLLVSILVLARPETDSQGGVTRARVHPYSCIHVAGTSVIQCFALELS